MGVGAHHITRHRSAYPTQMRTRADCLRPAAMLPASERIQYSIPRDGAVVTDDVFD